MGTGKSVLEAGALAAGVQHAAVEDGRRKRNGIIDAAGAKDGSKETWLWLRR